MRKPAAPSFLTALPAAMTTRIAITGVAGFLLVFGSGCLLSNDHGGSDTETLTGLLLSPDGNPAAGARVRLVPSTYDPSRPVAGLIREATTDANGRYAFPRAPSAGTYNLIAVGAQPEFGVYRPGLAAGTLPDTLSLAMARVLYINLHTDVYTVADSGKAWFPGSDLFVRCDGDTATKLGSLPRGLDDMVIESRAGWSHTYRITEPGDTLIVHADRFGVRCEPY